MEYTPPAGRVQPPRPDPTLDGRPAPPDIAPRNNSGEAMPQADDLALLQGTLDVLVLKALVWGPRPGYAVARWIKAASDGTLDVEARALYGALPRM